LKDKLTELFNDINSKLILPEEAKQIIENEKLPSYKSVKQELQEQITKL
jgi:hypothetical protein